MFWSLLSLFVVGFSSSTSFGQTTITQNPAAWGKSGDNPGNNGMFIFYGKSTGTLTAPAGTYNFKIKIKFIRLTNNGNQPAWNYTHEINSMSPNMNAPLSYNYNSENITIPAPPPPNGTMPPIAVLNQRSAVFHKHHSHIEQGYR